MSISEAAREYMKSSSWIRKMFETGIELKRRHGPDAVMDLSLGSPILEPPPQFDAALRELVNHPVPGMHRYMPNMGHDSTRRAVADHLSAAQGLRVPMENVMMTVGAAGGINVTMASILDPGDEVIVLVPYFAEYFFYVRHHGGAVTPVETTDTFNLDLDAVEAAIGPRTKAIIVNTPNNPTGRIYDAAAMTRLGEVLGRAEARLRHAVYLVLDTPYAAITYEGARNPPIFGHHPNTILAHSYSKELGLAGERIGFLAVSPEAAETKDLMDALAFNNRTLGFVNAPSLMQLAVERALSATVDITPYRRARDLLCTGLSRLGYDFVRPQGAFYLYPRTPIEDDMAFTRALADELVLVVPGRGFGRGGHVRIAFCTTTDVVERAIPAFGRVLDRL